MVTDSPLSNLAAMMRSVAATGTTLLKVTPEPIALEVANWLLAFPRSGPSAELERSTALELLH
jgi:hypothetical protein